MPNADEKYLKKGQMRKNKAFRDDPPTRKSGTTLWDAGTKPGKQFPHQEGYRKQTLGRQCLDCWVDKQRG